MNPRRSATRLVAALLLAGGGVLVAAGAAAATSLTPATYTGGGCPEVVHTSTADVTKTAGGKASIDPAGGLVFETTVVEDAVSWKHTLAGPVPMGAVDKMRYTTRKLDNGATNAAALPAYRVFLVDTNGANSATTLVYEPYYQIVGNPALNVTETWDVKAGKFWSTKTIAGITAEPGGSYAGNKTWAEIKTANPNAKVVAFSVGQGTYNAGTKARVNHVIFGAGHKCADHIWKPGSSASPSASASASASASPSASASSSSSAGGGNGGGNNAGGSLPVTGAKAAVVATVGVLIVLAGVGLVVASVRRKRVRFTT